MLSSGALVLLLWGLESLAHSEHPGWPLVLTLISVLMGAYAVRHFQRTAQPLLNLSSFKVPTYFITNLDAGLLVRIAINATPFLLPLLFQLGFGLSAWEAGTLVLVYFFGNLGIKPATTPLLRRFGFRQVLVVNGLLVGGSIFACAFLHADTARGVMMLVLLLAGASRSMQFTCLNTLSFADVAESQRGAATTLSSMVWQTSSVLAVACGALLLKGAQWWHGSTTPEVPEFRLAFVVLGVMGMLAALRFARLSPDAGYEVSGHHPSNA
jgi:MFS family permease